MYYAFTKNYTFYSFENAVIKDSIAMNFNPAKPFRIHCDGTINFKIVNESTDWVDWTNELCQIVQTVIIIH